MERTTNERKSCPGKTHGGALRPLALAGAELRRAGALAQAPEAQGELAREGDLIMLGSAVHAARGS